MPNLRSLEVVSLWASRERQWDPSADPFESLSTPPRCLSPHYVPLYSSFLNLRNLVEFTFFDPYSELTLDTTWTLLEENPSLRSVVLCVGSLEITSNYSRHRAPINNQLGYLAASGLEASLFCKLFPGTNNQKYLT